MLQLNQLILERGEYWRCPAHLVLSDPYPSLPVYLPAYVSGHAVIADQGQLPQTAARGEQAGQIEPPIRVINLGQLLQEGRDADKGNLLRPGRLGIEDAEVPLQEA